MVKEVKSPGVLTRPQQPRAGIPIYIIPCQRPGIGMGDDRLPVYARRIEIGIQHAALIGELQFAHRRITNVEPGHAEQALQPARIRSDDAARQGAGRGREASRRCRPTTIWHDTRTTGAKQEHKRQSRKTAHLGESLAAVEHVGRHSHAPHRRQQIHDG